MNCDFAFQRCKYFIEYPPHTPPGKHALHRYLCGWRHAFLVSRVSVVDNVFYNEIYFLEETLLYLVVIPR